jgi:hypothetical protein
MHTAFSLIINPELKNRQPYSTIVPSEGEDWGNYFRQQARSFVEKIERGESRSHWSRFAVQLFEFAADAFEAGAGASIGHNRTARYMDAARGCRNMAEELRKPGPENSYVFDIANGQKLRVEITGYRVGDDQMRRPVFAETEGYDFHEVMGGRWVAVPKGQNSRRASGSSQDEPDHTASDQPVQKGV